VRQGGHGASARDDDRRPCRRPARCAAAVEDGAGLSGRRWSGLCAPRGTPSEIIILLNKEVNLAMADPKIKERIASLGGVALPGSPAFNYPQFLPPW
jgi:tripartite-type tricarboxylate transporter receptor subunit TctC